MSDETKKVVIKVQADVKDAIAGFKNFGKISDDTIKKLSDVGKSTTSAFDDVKKAFGKLGEGIASAGEGVKKLSQALAPMNQAIELGGKAIRLAEAGLDAYGKTSKEAAAQVNKLKTEFSNYRDTVLEGVGAMTVALLGTAKGYEAQYQEILKIENSDLYKRFYKSNGQQRSVKDILGEYGIDPNDKATQERFARYGIQLGGGEKAGATDNKAVNALNDAWKGVSGTVGGLVDKWNIEGPQALKVLEESIEKTTEAQKKAAEEAKRWRLELAALASKNAKESTDELVKRLQAELSQPGELGDYDLTNRVDFGAAQSNINASLASVKELQAALAELQSPEQKKYSLLQQTFGSIDEMSLYRQELELTLGVVDAFGQAVGSSYEAIVTGQGSVSAAFKKMFADQLLALGKSSVVEAIKETALGFGALASYQYPAATLHFKSAALHGAVAVAAGVGAAALGAGGGGGNAAAASPAASTPGRDQRTGFGGGNGTNSVLIVYADPFADQDQRQRALTAEKTWRRVQGSTGSQDS